MVLYTLLLRHSIITFTEVSVDDNAKTAKKYKISNDNTTAVKLFDVTTEYNDAISNGANFSSSNLLSKDVIPNDTVLDKGKIIAIQVSHLVRPYQDMC